MNKNIRNRKLNRLKDYNYSEEGYYFITICTKGMLEWFGKIENDKMILNKFGKFVKEQWIKIPNYYKIVDIDEFIIMPNHIHEIVIINKSRADPTKKTERSSVPTNNKDGHYGLIS